MCTRNTSHSSQKMQESWTLRRCGNFNTGRAEIVLDLPNIVIGRNVEKKYRVDSVNISRQHACLNFSDSRTWVVQDLRSRNGIYVNGTKIEPCASVRLSENDTIGFGRPSPCGDDIFVYRLCRDPPLRLKQEADAAVEAGRSHPTLQTVVREPVTFEISDDDDEPIVTEIVFPKKRRRTEEKEWHSSSLQAGGMPLIACSAIKKEPTLEVTNVKSEPSVDCLASGSSATTCNGFTAKTEQDTLDTGKPSSSCVDRTLQHTTVSANIKKEVTIDMSEVVAVKEEPREAAGIFLHKGGLSDGPNMLLCREMKQGVPDGNVAQDGAFCTAAVKPPLTYENVPDGISSSVVSLTDTWKVKTEETSLCKENSTSVSCSTVVPKTSAANVPAKESNVVPLVEDMDAPGTSRECMSSHVQDKQDCILKECTVLLRRLEQTLTAEGRMMGFATPKADPVKHTRNDVAEQAQDGCAFTTTTEAVDATSTFCDTTPTENGECQSVPVLSECIGGVTPAAADTEPSSSSCDRVSHGVAPFNHETESVASTSHHVEPVVDIKLSPVPFIKEERTDEDNCELPQFSQEDAIVILSDDEDSESGPSILMKKEPEEFDDHICNQEEEDDGDLWVTHEFLVNVKSEPGDTMLALPPDEALLGRLVWDHEDSVEENSSGTDHVASEHDLLKDRNEEEPESKRSRQDENDFFPVLSQSFYSDDEDNSERTRGTDSHHSSERVPSSTFRRANFTTPLPASKAAPRKSSLRERVMKSMKHRVPMPGGGSAVKVKEMPERQLPSSSSESTSSSKLFYKVNRFKSRAIHLLDVGESIAVADGCKNRPVPRRVKPTHGVFNKAVERRVDQLLGAKHGMSSGYVQVQNAASGAPSAFPGVQQTTQMSLPRIVSEEARTAKGPLRVPASEHGHEMPHASGQLPALLETCSKKRPRLEGPFPAGLGKNDWHLDTVVKCQQLQDKPRVHFSEESLAAERSEQERAEFADRVRSSLKQRKLMKKSPKVSITTFIGFILSWKVQWLKEQLYCSKAPPLLDMSKVHAKRAMYSSFEEYVYLHYNFLCLETWDQVFHNWKEHFSQTAKMTYSIVVAEQTVKHRAERASDSIMQLSCSLIVKPESLKKGAYPLEGHLVRLDLRLREKENAVLPVFGFIVQSRIAKNKHPTKASLPVLLQNDHVDGCVEEHISVQVKTRDLALNFAKTVRLTVVSKISPIMRQVEAILDLDRSPFLQSIIRPNPQHFWNRRLGPLHPSLLQAYNLEQAEVICSAVSAVRAPGKEQRILLLHGPPGTGKTHTLVGIVLELIRSCENQKLLVVAPSNTAVDEIGRRLLAARARQARDGVHVDSLLKVVRVGQEHMIHQDVRGIWLEELVQKNIQKEMREKAQDFDQEISMKQAHVKHCMEKIKCIASSSYPDWKAQRRLEFEVQHLNTEILRITEKKKAFLDELVKHSRNYYGRKVVLLQRAHIVLSTINSSRGRLLEEAFGRNSQHSFTCVIVDEATQCTEVELLLSLQYRASRLVLVGDPHQLPATILSRDAINLNFQQSLFERFYDYLKEYESSRPIFLLTSQCRMHTEICSFPSRYFYGGKLQTTRGLDESYASFPLIPYIIFNIANSPEHTEGTTSWLNVGEAQFVCLLCEAVLEQTACRASIGVITPYVAQKNLIASCLGAHSLVEVNTIDGFQGQERDVIILSCVRAYHPRGSIGFVADARRLNVAVTRAKKSLFICGHLQSLEDSAEWAALIQDGVTRNKVCNVSPNFSTHIVRHIISRRGTLSASQDDSRQQ